MHWLSVGSFGREADVKCENKRDEMPLVTAMASDDPKTGQMVPFYCVDARLNKNSNLLLCANHDRTSCVEYSTRCERNSLT